jgi:hypothetical protein
MLAEETRPIVCPHDKSQRSLDHMKYVFVALAVWLDFAVFLLVASLIINTQLTGRHSLQLQKL